MDRGLKARIAVLAAGIMALSTTIGVQPPVTLLAATSANPVEVKELVAAGGAEAGRAYADLSADSALAYAIPRQPGEGIYQPPPPAVRIRRLSVSTAGVQGNGATTSPIITPDARFVVFESSASNLVAGDTNNVDDAFLRDLTNGTTERVSTSGTGAQANGGSGPVAISADGRYVVLNSSASNLIWGDTNGFADAFLKDRQTGAVLRISTAANGAQGDDHVVAVAISADRRYVLLESAATTLGVDGIPGQRDVFVKDRQTGAVELISVGLGGAAPNSLSYARAMSSDGRYVAFLSLASNLVADDTNGVEDAFVRDRQTGITTRVSVSANGTQANGASQVRAMTPDGRFVVFESQASNLVSGDNNGFEDVFVKDRQTGTVERVSITAGGTQGNSYSYGGSISSDGRYVLFSTDASRLWPNDVNGELDVLLKDRQTGAIEMMSVSAGGTQTNDASHVWHPAISADARYVVFWSLASTLVPNDTNGTWDAFLVDRSVPVGP